LQYNFNWKSLSVAAGLTLWNFYFRIYAGAIKKEQVVDFLKALARHLDQPLLIVWDRLPGHRSRLVQDYIAGPCSVLTLQRSDRRRPRCPR
jgi:hypothetical protein